MARTAKKKAGPRVALIAGATGLVGAECLRLLLEQQAYTRVKALVRRAPAAAHAKLEVVQSDFSDLAALGARLACDDVYCCLGTTLARAGGRAEFERVDYHMVVGLARAAQEAGATRFVVVSSVGASRRSPSFYSRVKARMERAVADAGFAAVHIVRPSLLLGARSESRPAEDLAQRLAPVVGPLLRGGLSRYRPVRAEEVAQAMLQLGLHGDAGVHVHHLPLADAASAGPAAAGG